MTSIELPTGRYVLREPVSWPKPEDGISSRVAFAAAHVVPGRLAANVPNEPARLDWDATLAFRRHLWSYGLGVAEAMDTAQRGMGLDWVACQELIRRTANEANLSGGRLAAGVGTDHAPPRLSSLHAVVHAYEEQLAFVEANRTQAILMGSRQLAELATGPDDYRVVYDRLLGQVSDPVILHWLGTMFDPALRGYWGSTDIDLATEYFVELVREYADMVDGVKVSLLDAEHEIRLRAALPDGVRLYTGDDFNYLDLIRGDGERHSDALLGVFAAIAPAASAALQALDRDDVAGYEAALAPTVPLGRHIFGDPTYFYKTGIAFLTWLAGHQPGFQMVGGQQSARSVSHLVHAFTLADVAGLLPDPELAVQRMTSFLRVAGF